MTTEQREEILEAARTYGVAYATNSGFDKIDAKVLAAREEQLITLLKRMAVFS